MSATIDLRFFASLRKFSPPSADTYPITPGATVRDLLRQLGVPLEKAKLIFVNGLKKDLDARLEGGERVGIFPPVGGG
ncbi:MAG: MoaD/ThiS family protein [Deltaproteobacteria bacterium]|jgi:sulfur-carrier protein|nr:MoaD/ThiS family protein [Deltaproteobacteria bacterium]